MFKYTNKLCGVCITMLINENIREFIKRLSKVGLNRIFLLFSISFFIDGVFEFVYFWFSGAYVEALKKTNWFILTPEHIYSQLNFFTYCIWFAEVYSVLFIPLMVYLGYKYINYKNKNLTIIFSSFIIIIFSILSYLSFRDSPFPILNEWIFFFILIYFILLKSDFSFLFSFSFTYLMFFMANIIFQIPENFHEKIVILPSLLACGLQIFMFITVLYKIGFRLNVVKSVILILSFIPVFLGWIFLDISSASNPNNYVVRLITFPFFIVVSLIIYFERKHTKCYIPNQANKG